MGNYKAFDFKLWILKSRNEKNEDYTFILEGIDSASFESDFKCTILKNMAALKSLDPDQLELINQKIQSCS